MLLFVLAIASAAPAAAACNVNSTGTKHHSFLYTGTYCYLYANHKAGALATAATHTLPAQAMESDVKSVGEKGETGAALMCNYMQATLTSLAALPLVSVAAVDGYAIGGGSELATACDYRIVRCTHPTFKLLTLSNNLRSAHFFYVLSFVMPKKKKDNITY